MTARERSNSWNHKAEYSLVSGGTSLSSETDYAWVDTMEDTVTPRYHFKVKTGALLDINPMSQYKTLVEIPTSDTEWRHEIYSGGSWHTSALTTIGGNLVLPKLWQIPIGVIPAGYQGPVEPDWPDIGELQVSALADARNQAFDVTTFLAEVNKTVELVKSVSDATMSRATRVANAITSRKKGRGLKYARWLAQNSVSAFAQTWLEARYGWRTLAFDIAGLQEAFDRLDGMRGPLRRGYAFDTTTVRTNVLNGTSSPVTYYSPSQSYGLGNISQVDFSIDQSMTREVRAGSLVEMLMTGILNIDPISTAWEVVPYSFITDWFVDVGDNLRAFSPLANSVMLGSWLSTRETISQTGTSTPVIPVVDFPLRYTLTGGPSTYSAETKTYERYETDPKMDLSFRLRLDTAKLLDLGSILSGHLFKTLKGIRKSTSL